MTKPIMFERNNAACRILLEETREHGIGTRDARVEDLRAAGFVPEQDVANAEAAAEHELNRRRRRAETAESRLREVAYAADAVVKSWGEGDGRQIGTAVQCLRGHLDSLPRPETTTMTEETQETEKNDVAKDVDMVVPIRVQPAAAKADEVAPSESAASEELEPGRFAHWRFLQELSLFCVKPPPWEELCAADRIAWAAVERACIERGRREAQDRAAVFMQREADGFRDQLAAKDREIAELREAHEAWRKSETKAHYTALRIAYDARNEVAATLNTVSNDAAELRRQLSAKDAKIAELASELDRVDCVLVIRRGLPTPVEGNALQGYTPAREIPTGGQYVAPKPIQTSPFPSVARESAKAWRTQAEPFFPEREAAGKATTALRDEVRRWLGDVKPSEAILSKSMVNGYPIVPAERFAAIEWFLDEIWARAQGSK